MPDLKKIAGEAALDFIEDNIVVGIGTGRTVNSFISVLSGIKHRIEACVASSLASEKLLKEAGFQVLDLNLVSQLPIYIDGADEVDRNHAMIKGGGGALTREKIIASAAEKFICIVDDAKLVTDLGQFPIAVEVIPLARSFVARELVALGGNPEYRHGFITDNGNIIIDVFDLDLTNLVVLEDAINCIPGVVENGIFSKRLADSVIVASNDGVQVL
ncbi:MAG: ribose-5-phosphate isomerase RpiA [Legionellaceae bacterium]|nr:ribose-5-phosphate isomerase RpiA [Legionellaceae bacterium]